MLRLLLFLMGDFCPAVDFLVIGRWFVFCFYLENLYFVVFAVFLVGLFCVDYEVVAAAWFRFFLGMGAAIGDRIHVEDAAMGRLDRKQDHLRGVGHGGFDAVGEVQVFKILMCHIRKFAV